MNVYLTYIKYYNTTSFHYIAAEMLAETYACMVSYIAKQKTSC